MLRKHGRKSTYKKMITPVPSTRYPLLMSAANVEAAVEWALAFLGAMRFLVTKPCVVFDIDGTLVFNAEDGSSKAIRAICALARACAKAGITIFVITARVDEPQNRRHTERLLESCRMPAYAQLFMRPAESEYGTYKYRMRADIRHRGYGILLSIGDQFADVNGKEPTSEINDHTIYCGQIGDHGQFGIKLPSEFE